MNSLFKKYKPGTVFNPLKGSFEVDNRYSTVKLGFPSRLNAMAIDPAKIAANDNMIFTPGEVVFSVKIYKNILVRKTGNQGEILIAENTKRGSLIIHAVRIMQKALDVNDGLYIEVDNGSELRHSGLGSSSALIAGVSAAINELYGSPIEKSDLNKYVAQNHGEEIDGDEENIQQVQCIGGSAASGYYNAGLIVLAGESIVVAQMKIDSSYKVVIGIPEDFVPMDSREMMELEEKNLDKFVQTGEKYGPEIAYRMLHEAMPGLVSGDMSRMGDLIFDYRFKMGSIDNCSFIYPRMNDIAKKIAYLKDKVTPVLSLSSVGPAFFAVSKHSDKIVAEFRKNGMNVIITEIENNKYKSLRK